MHQLISISGCWCRGCVLFNYRVFVAAMLLVIFAASPLYSQLTPRTDSLKNLLKESQSEQRVEVLLQLSDQISRSDIQLAINYAREALELAERLEQSALEGESHRKLGRYLSKSGNNPEGLQHLLEAKLIFERLENVEKRALALENLGALYRRQSDYSRALEYYYDALQLKEQANHQLELTNTLQNIGVINEELGQTQKAVTFYERALDISQKYNDPSEIAINAVQLGNAYATAGKTDQAIQKMNMALEASERLPGQHARASILLEISELHRDESAYRQAVVANQQALELAHKMSDNRLQALAFKNLALIHKEQKHWSQANIFLQRALPLFKQSGMLEEAIRMRNQLAENYLVMEDLSRSIEAGKRALERAEQVSAFQLQRFVLGVLVEAYRQSGELENALRAQSKLLAVEDSLHRRAQSRQVAEIQARYETKKKEQEIALLEKEKQQQAMLRNAFLAGLILLVIIGLLVYNRQRLKIKKNRAELENKRLKEQQLEQDLEFKNKRLTTHTLHLVQKNEAMKELKEKVNSIRQKNGDDINRALQKLQNMVDYSFALDEDWEEFQIYFEEVHSGFFDVLKEQYPALTPNELRLSALAKLNLSIKETATIMGITPNSVKTARYRLRKKLDIETEESLTEFMMQVEKSALE